MNEKEGSRQGPLLKSERVTDGSNSSSPKRRTTRMKTGEWKEKDLNNT